MTAIVLFRKCERCNGTGSVIAFGQPTITCPDCGGSKRMPFIDSEELTNALTIGIDKYFPSWKVLDCVDATEYAALVDAAKDGLRIILSVGVLFLGTGSKQLANLRAIFPSGVTRTALDALVA